MGDIELVREKHIRLERINEIGTYLVIISGLLVIQLPLPFDLNKNIIYLVAFLAGIFAVFWHRLLPKKFSGLNKNFIESLVGITGLFLIVINTGGVRSYFYFLYFLVVLSSAVYMPLRASIALAGVVNFLTLALAFGSFNTREFSLDISIVALQIWSIWLILAYGRYLSGEIGVAKKREEDIQLQEIREVDKLKDEFIFIISHELRSPITAIRGYLEFLISDSVGEINEKTEVILKKAFITSNKLSNLVSLLLEAARFETGKIHFYVQNTSIKEILDKVLYNLNFEIEEKNLDVRADVDEKLAVKIDSERFEEMLNIIIGNAAVYTPEFGKVEAKARKLDSMVEIKISDTGIGMSPEKIEHLFEKFYIEETGLGEKTIKGTNIGLYVVKELLSKMGGGIVVRSKVGEGTTFTISLPTA